MYTKYLIYLSLFSLSLAVPLERTALADKKKPAVETSTDPREKPELTVCSQNLENYGTPAATMARLGINSSGFAAKQKALVTRFKNAGCDVIAVQEVLAKNQEDGKKVLTQLANALRESTQRFFDIVVGTSNDANIRNGFLIAKDRAELINNLSYTRVELPKISKDQKPRLFLRSPLEIQLSVKPWGEGKPRTATLINLHFKSKSGSAGDPTGLEWETYRMEMAEAVRRIVELRHKNALSSSDNILLVLGDRNANFDLASAKILEGLLALSDFKEGGDCRLSKRGVPLCKTGAGQAQILFSVLSTDPQTKGSTGTFHYKKTYSWIDDILLPAESLRMAWANYDSVGDYDSGVVFTPEEASDHALVYVRLNW